MSIYDDLIPDEKKKRQLLDQTNNYGIYSDLVPSKVAAEENKQKQVSFGEKVKNVVTGIGKALTPVGGWKEGLKRVTSTPLKEYFMPTSSGFLNTGENINQLVAQKIPMPKFLEDVKPAEFNKVTKFFFPGTTAAMEQLTSVPQSIKEWNSLTPTERQAKFWTGFENTTVPFLRTYYPSAATLATIEKFTGQRASTKQEIEQRAPLLSLGGQLAGDLTNILSISRLTGGIPAIQGPAWLRTVSPYLYRTIPQLQKQGLVWGIKGLLDESLIQYVNNIFNPKELITKTGKETAFGFFMAPVSQIESTGARILSTGLARGSWSLLDSKTKSGKLTKTDYLNAGANAILGMAFETIGGKETSRKFTESRLYEFNKEMTINKLMSNGDTRKEAEIIFNTLEKLHGAGLGLKFGTRPAFYQEYAPATSMMKYIPQEQQVKVADQVVSAAVGRVANGEPLYKVIIDEFSKALAQLKIELPSEAIKTEKTAETAQEVVKVYRTAKSLEPDTQVFTNRTGAEAFATPEEPVREFVVNKADLTPSEIPEKADAGIMNFNGKQAIQPNEPEKPVEKGVEVAPSQKTAVKTPQAVSSGTKYTLAPSKAEKSEQVIAEATSLDRLGAVEQKRVPGTDQVVTQFKKANVGNIEIKQLLKYSPEFRANPVLTVDENKNLVFRGTKQRFLLKPEGMQISTERLAPGDTVYINPETLKGKINQLRIRNEKGEVVGFNPKSIKQPIIQLKGQAFISPQGQVIKTPGGHYAAIKATGEPGEREQMMERYLATTKSIRIVPGGEKYPGINLQLQQRPNQSQWEAIWKTAPEKGTVFLETPSTSGSFKYSSREEMVREIDNFLSGKPVENLEIKVDQTSELGFNPKVLEEPTSPQATVETDKLIKQSEIAKTLSEKLNVPIRRGKFRMAGAIGLYKPQAQVVRIKSGGLATIFHEVAHYLDDLYKFSKDIGIVERKELMQEYGFKYTGRPDKQKKEAFAEFIRFRMTGQKAKTDAYAPELSKRFDEEIKKYPDVKNVLDTAAADYQRWMAQPAVAKVLSQISIGSQNNESFKDRAINKIHDLYTAALDDLHPLSGFTTTAIRKLGEIPADQNPYILARNLRGWVGKADLFLTKGTFSKKFWKLDEKGNAQMDFTGKGYSEILKPIVDAGKVDEFRVYLVSKRIVEDLAPKGITTGISVADAKAVVAELETKNPEFIKVAEERQKYEDALLQFAVDNGVIGEEGYKKIKANNKFHVPFYRVMEESTGGYLGKRKVGGNLSNPIKRMKGSEREIIDPLESDIKNTYAIINAAERNNIGVAMATLASRDPELGRMFEKVATPMKNIKVDVGEVMKKALAGTDVNPEDLPEELGQTLVNLFRPTRATGPNMLNVNFGDDQAVYQVEPELFKSIQGLNVEDVGIIMRILSTPAKLLRAGATLTPDFSVRNPLRDQFTAMAYSKYGFIPGVDLVRGMFELFQKGDIYDLWKASGGEHSMFVSLDREFLQKTFKEIMENNGGKALDFIKSPLKLLQIISEFGEAGTRLGEMRRAIRSGADPVKAAFDSREVTLDFARIGAKTKAINSIIAFWNANLQGTDKMIRSFKDKPFKTLMKVLLGITLPSVLLYLANRKDPRWREIPQWQKNLFWIVMTSNHIYRIPKPFELGILFGSLPERIMEVIDNKDPQAFSELEKSIADGFSPGFIPTALLPVIENITNYSFFSQRPIVSQGQLNLPPEKQAGNYTSETAKIIGEALKYSPSKIDNLIYGYTGGLGRYAVSAMDKIIEGTGITSPVPAPADNFEDTPILKAFMIREPVGSASESVNRIYDLYGKSSAELNYVRKLAKEGQLDEAKKYSQEHPDIKYAAALSGLTAKFTDINKVANQVRASKTLTPEEKRDKLNQLNKLETELAQKLLDKIQKEND